MDKLENIIEALLFLSGTEIEIKDITEKLEITAKEVEAAVKLLKEKYSGDCGIHLLSFNKKIQLSSNPDYAFLIESVLNPIKERELSKAMLEVASIIAYKQPVTRLDVEDIRGVNSDYAITMLCKHNIIEAAGRKDTVGKPILYRTTDDFLKRFGLSSLDDLPDYEDILSRIKILNPQEPNDLYYRENYQEKIGGADEEKSVADGEALSEEKTAAADGENIEKQDILSPKNSDILGSEELPDFLKGEQDLKIIG